MIFSRFYQPCKGYYKSVAQLKIFSVYRLISPRYVSSLSLKTLQLSETEFRNQLQNVECQNVLDFLTLCMQQHASHRLNLKVFQCESILRYLARHSLKTPALQSNSPVSVQSDRNTHENKSKQVGIPKNTNEKKLESKMQNKIHSTITSASSKSSAPLYSSLSWKFLIDNTIHQICEADGRLLSMLMNTIAIFQNRDPYLVKLSSEIHQHVIQLPNFFSPRHIASLATSFATIKIHSPATVEFIRTEAISHLQAFQINDLLSLLEAFRIWGVFDRELMDNVVEQLSQKLDRFTGANILQVLQTFSLLGLARGFFLRRVVFKLQPLLEEFSVKHLAIILHALTKLRFTADRQCIDIVELIEPLIQSLPSAQLAEFVLSLALLDLTSKECLVRECIQLFTSTSLQTKSTQSLVDVAYGICYFNILDHHSTLQSLLDIILNRHIQRNRTTLQKLHEIIQDVTIEKRLDLQRIKITNAWKSAIDEADRLDQKKCENSRVHNEIVLLLQELYSTIPNKIERNSSVGPYRLDIFIELKNLCIDLDMISHPLSKMMKHRHLQKLGYKTICIPYWQWRRCRSEVEQLKFLKELIQATSET